ncbi:class I SAM-dependent methyltransferase [Myxosarcina sp. GI1]|uniref:class I SAM-dependent methyltransferase n=1 Tax=Myxosarcina sp. GI1 TaxID=1541065 RepID=UPI00068F8227|nr:class I SAM-dependent methyltransferase [Myxosarcina sp. GI1]
MNKGKSESWSNIYREIADNYSRQARESWYSKVADAYDRTRPRYSQAVCDRIIELTNLSSSSTVLELGCGPGIATVPFARLGCSLVCLEPSYEACQLARQNCRQHPQVEIINTTFEAWELNCKNFDAVLAASSFHWLDPEIKYRKTAAALKDDGSLILLWNTPPQLDFDIYQSLQEIYQTHAPAIEYRSITSHQHNLNQIAETVIDSGYYHDLQSDWLIREVTYSLDDYITMLSTLSPYIMLEARNRELLFAGIRELLQQKCGESLQLSNLIAWHIARKM